MKIAIDLGASQTRVMAAQQGSEVKVLPNTYVSVEIGTDVRLERVDGPLESNLDVSISRLTAREEDMYFPVRVLLGELAARHSTRLRQPQALEPKHLQQINYCSILTALATQVIDLGMDLKKQQNVELYLALPPVEVRADGLVEYIEDVLKDRFAVEFPLDNVSVDLNITKIHVFEESRLACIAYSFNEDLTPTELGKEIHNNQMTVLSVDIGASTTDLVIIKNGTYRENSGATIKRGGNFIAAELRNLVEQKHKFQPTTEDIAVAVTTGTLKKGANVLDVTDLLKQAKDTCAKEMIADIEDYFTRQAISPNSIEVVLVSGGGSMASYKVEAGKNKETTEPFAFYLERELKALSDLRVEYFSANSETSPREANIIGLIIRARVDIAKKEKVEGRENKASVKDTKTSKKAAGVDTAVEDEPNVE